MNLNFKSSLFVTTVLFLLSFIPPDKKIKFIDPANMDATVKPGDNFYQYSNGKWVKNNPVPASKTSWGSFGMLTEENSNKLRRLIEDEARNPSSPKFKRVADYYLSGMDSMAIERAGYEPLLPHFERINNIRSTEDILNEIAYERVNGISGPLVGIFVWLDKKDATKYIPQIGQGGTTLPDRDYYLKNDARSVTIRNEFISNITNMFKLVGRSEAEATKNAWSVMRIETALAKAQMTRTELRDPYKSYNKFSWKDLSSTTPSIDWKSFAEKLKVKGIDSVVVSNPAYLKTIDILLGALPVEDWKAYLQWDLINSCAAYLSNAFVQQNFAFNKILTGQKQITPRWQRLSNEINSSMGDLLGEMYVTKYFTPEAKKRMLDLVNNLQKTYAERIKRLDWMSEETKQRALAKLNAFTKKIGYADKWKDYSTVEIDQSDYLGNSQRLSKWAVDDNVSLIGKPIDKSLWLITAPTVNAGYNPSGNEVIFPAGILQFPFFAFEADDAVNYGAIGVGIGHEMTHGFDDQGRQYDLNGNLTDWWTKEDADKFKAKADKVANLYSGFTVLDSLHLNGRLTLGENIADIGGVNIAYEAFTKTKQFKEGKKIDGFTPAQRFFLGFAQLWRENILPERAAQLVLIDPHSPGLYRVNGTLPNIDAWYDAFNVKPGDRLYKSPDQRIKIW
ncbi:MAG TPA: M13 family metallopeptidase [Chitinophagaceae bacterium]|nr:M13 family metallopeptidase [Chitinophagaceae bacterium]